MSKNALWRILTGAAALALLLSGCGGGETADTAESTPTTAVQASPDPNPPAAQTETAEETEPATDELASTPTPTPTPTPEPTPEPTPSLRPGEYTGEDGSVLTVNEDGTCTYETLVSGTVNGKAMSGRLTFHGTVEDGVFSFTKVTYFGLDLTSIAAEAGYDDASYWEAAAALLYAG